MSADISLLAARAGLVILAPVDIAALPADERVIYLARLRAFCLDNNMHRQGPYEDWLRYADRCRHYDPDTGEGCTRKRWEGNLHCVRHLDLSEIDPAGYVKVRSDKARLRMADMLDTAVDQLENILNLPPEEVPPAVRLKAIDTLFDRAGVPKMSTATLDARVEVTDSSEARTVIAQRLDALAAALPAAGHEDTTAGIVDGEIVE